jgi:hypothetical protein
MVAKTDGTLAAWTAVSASRMEFAAEKATGM